MQKKDRKRTTVLLSLCSRECSPKAYGFSKGLVINVLVTSLIVSTKHLREAMCGRKGLLWFIVAGYTALWWGQQWKIAGHNYIHREEAESDECWF